MSDLTDREQRHVRTALRFLRHRIGSWNPLAESLGLKRDSLDSVAKGRSAVTAGVAFRLARLVDVSIDDLLGGKWLSPRVCPHCGHPPDDFTDEETIVGDGSLSPDILKLVK